MNPNKSNKMFRNFVFIILVLTLFVLSISIASASCENSVIYYGTCTPNGNIEVSLNDGVNTNILAQTSCSSGLFATHIGRGGSGCTIEESDLVLFNINGVSAGNQTWNGNLINFVSIDGTPAPVIIPQINAPPKIVLNFNNNSNFKSGDNFGCSARIVDEDGDTVQGVSSSLTSIVNSSYSWASINNMLSTPDCVLVNNSQSEVICSVNFNYTLPVGGVECSFYAGDGKNYSQLSSSLNVVNSPPQISPSIVKYSGPVNTTINLVLTILDNDINQIYDIQKNNPLGVLNISNILSPLQHTFSWTPEENDTGNYTFGFTVSDGYDSSTITVPFEIFSQGQPVSVPNPQPQSPSGGGGGGRRKNYVKVNESNDGNGGGCYSYRDVEDRKLKCVGKAGQQVEIKQRAFCWGNFTGPSDSFNIVKYACPLPPEPEQQEILPPVEQKPEPQVSRWWLWVIIAIIIIVVIMFTVYELKQRGVFDGSNKDSKYNYSINNKDNISKLNNKLNSKFDYNSYNTNPNKKLDNKEIKSTIKPVSKPSTPPKVSAHVSVGEIESKINRANQLFDKGRIDEVKELIHEIASDYKIMTPEDRAQIYPEYMKLFEKIRASS